MARTASLTVAGAEALIGMPRGSAVVMSTNRAAFQKWLVAKGVPAVVAKGAKLATLAKAYNGTNDAYLRAMIANAADKARDAAAEAAAMAEIEAGTAEVTAEGDDAAAVAAAADATAATWVAGEAAAANAIESGARAGGAVTTQAAAATAASAGNGAAALVAALQRMLAEAMAASAGAVDAEQVRAIVAEEIAKVGTVATVIEVRTHDGSVKIEGRQHAELPTLLRAATSRLADGYAPNVWLSGPAGSGKTTAAKTVAKALQRSWWYNGAVSMPHEVVGFVDAGGTYRDTAFRRAYQDGGVYLFDEVDASDDRALLALNAALANGVASFPDAMVARHPDSLFMAAANTWGLGATAEYVGRARMDGAFLDRFHVKLQWSYDEALERETCGNPDWAVRVQAARKRAADRGLKVLISPRASYGGAALIAAGMTADDAARLTYLATLTPEQRRQVEG